MIDCIQPLEDFEFNAAHFATTAISLSKQLPVENRVQSKEKLSLLNKQKLELLGQKAKLCEDPFQLVNEDLKKTKEFAITNILQTDYKELENASKYNLQLKGKNFRSAILFLLSRALYKDKGNFEQIYHKV